jgi:hypothetical protein
MSARLTVFAGAGVLGVARGAIGYLGPRYWEPSSALDWTAVVLFSAFLLAAATSLFVLAHTMRRAHASCLRAAAFGAGLAGVGSAVEDGIGVNSFGYAFAAGTALMAASLLLAGLLLALLQPGSRPLGLLLVAVVPVLALAFDNTGLIAFGLALAVIGVARSRQPSYHAALLNP